MGLLGSLATKSTLRSGRVRILKGFAEYAANGDPRTTNIFPARRQQTSLLPIERSGLWASK